MGFEGIDNVYVCTPGDEPNSDSDDFGEGKDDGGGSGGKCAISTPHDSTNPMGEKTKRVTASEWSSIVDRSGS